MLKVENESIRNWSVSVFISISRMEVDGLKTKQPGAK